MPASKKPALLPIGIFIALGCFWSAPTALSETEANARASQDNKAKTWQRELNAKTDPYEAYAWFKQSLNSALAWKLLPELLELYQRSLNRSLPSGSSTEKKIRQTWAADALKQKHEALRLIYSRLFTFSPLNKTPLGKIPILKLRPGETLEIDWYEIESQKPPPRDLHVEWAKMQMPWRPDSASFSGGGTWKFRKHAGYYSIRHAFQEPGLYRITAHSPDFFAQTYASVTSIDMLTKSEAGRISIWGSSPQNQIPPPYRAHILVDHKDTVLMTDSLGWFELPRDLVGHSKDKPRLALEKQGHWAFLETVPWLSPEKVSSLRGMIYTDKPKYRPGDSLRFNGWIKRNQQGTLDDSLGLNSVEVTLTDPSDERRYHAYLQLGELGQLTDSLVLPEKSETGLWQLSVNPVFDRERKRSPNFQAFDIPFLVEDYRKPESEITLRAHFDTTHSGLRIRIQAKTYFGMPLSQAPTKVKIWQTPFLHFAPNQGSQADRFDSISLDKQGKCDTVLSFDAKALVSYWVSASVRGLDGREVDALVRVETQPTSSGLILNPDRFRCEIGDRLTMHWRRIPGDEDALPLPRQSTTRLQILRAGQTVFDTTLKTEIDSHGEVVFFPEKTGRYQWVATPHWGGKPIVKDFLVVQIIGKPQPMPLDIRWAPVTEKNRDSLHLTLHGAWGESPLLVTLEGETLLAKRILVPDAPTQVKVQIPLPKYPMKFLSVTVTHSGNSNWTEQSKNLSLPRAIPMAKTTLQSRREWKPGELFDGLLRITDSANHPLRAKFSIALVDEALYAQLPFKIAPMSDLLPRLEMNQVTTTFEGEGEQEEWPYALNAATPSLYNTLSSWYFTDHSDPYSRFGRNWGFPYGRKKIPLRHTTLKLVGLASRSRHKVWPSGMSDTNFMVMCLAAPPQSPPSQPTLKWRSNFKDIGYWNSSVQTDAKGEARIAFPLPDDLTRWRLWVRGTGPGETLIDFTQSLTTQLEVMSRLALPRHWVAGDSLSIGNVIHIKKQPTSPLSVSLRVEDTTLIALLGDSVQTLNARKGSARKEWATLVKQAGETRIHGAVQNEQFRDGEIRPLIIAPKGWTREIAMAGATGANGNDTLQRILFASPQYPEPGSASLSLEATTDPWKSLMPAMRGLIEYPYGCIEQTLSRFIPIIAVTEAFQSRSPIDTLWRKQLLHTTLKGLERLDDLQMPEGLWGWWHSGFVNLPVSALAVEGLASLRPEDLPFSGRERLSLLLDRASSGIEMKLDSLRFASPYVFSHVLAARHRAWPAKQVPNFARLRMQHTDSLPLYAVALLLPLARDKHWNPEFAALLARVEQSAQGSPQGNFWLPDTIDPWYDDTVEVTARCLAALAEIKPDHSLLLPSVLWLMQKRDGELWKNTRVTAQVLKALARVPNLLRPPTGEAEIGIALNGTHLGNGHWKSGESSSHPVHLAWKSQQVIPLLNANGLQQLSIQNSSGARWWWTARWKYAQEIPQQANFNLPMKINRWHAKVIYQKMGNQFKRRVLTSQRNLRVGDEVEVKLTLDSPSPHSYMAIEEPFPAGFEPLPFDSEWRQTWAPSSYWGGTDPEIHTDRITFVLEHLPKGLTTISYRLRAEIAGRFTAKPTHIQAMYSPEQQAFGPQVSIQVRP